MKNELYNFNTKITKEEHDINLGFDLISLRKKILEICMK